MTFVGKQQLIILRMVIRIVWYILIREFDWIQNEFSSLNGEKLLTLSYYSSKTRKKYVFYNIYTDIQRSIQKQISMWVNH